MREHEACALGVRRVYPYLSAQFLYERLADGESETRALPERIELAEAFEHLRSLLLRYAAARVAHTDAYHVVLAQLLERNGYRALLRTLLCVGSEVGEHLQQAFAVGLYHQTADVRLDAYLHIRRLVVGFGYLRRRVHERHHVVLADVELQLASLYLRHLEHVVYELPQFGIK